MIHDPRRLPPDDGGDDGDPARGLAVGLWLGLAFWAVVAIAGRAAGAWSRGAWPWAAG